MCQTVKSGNDVMCQTVKSGNDVIVCPVREGMLCVGVCAMWECCVCHMMKHRGVVSFKQCSICAHGMLKMCSSLCDSDIFLPLLSSSCPVFSSSLSYSNPSPLSISLLCHLFVPFPCFTLSLHAPSPCVSALFHFSSILLSCRTRTRSFVPL